jgi:hypothetical protein
MERMIIGLLIVIGLVIFVGAGRKSPHPAFGHLLPFRFAQRAKAMKFKAFARLPLQMGEGARRADEGSYSRFKSMLSHTPFKLVNISWLQTRSTCQPCVSKNVVRFLSFAISAAVLWVTPSTAIINFCWRQAKSAKYGPMLNWRTNLWLPRLRSRNASHNINSDWFSALRSTRERVLARAERLAMGIYLSNFIRGQEPSSGLRPPSPIRRRTGESDFTGSAHTWLAYSVSLCPLHPQV